MASSQSKVRVTFVESGSPTSSSNSLSMSAFDHCDSGPDNKMAAGNSVSSSSSSLQQSSKPVLMKQSSNSSNGSADLPRSPSMPSLVKFNSKQPPSAIGSNKSNGHRLSYSNQLIQSQQYEVIRKRQYRIGLNLFNKSHPERGIDYLIKNGFIDYTHNQGALDESGELQSSMTFTEHQEALARAVAAFLLNRKGLSKQMIGEYIGNLQSPFNQLVLDEFIKLVDFTGLPVDTALRKYQSTFRFPGEAQKIEKLVDVFSFRYADCNSHNMPKVRSADCDHSHLNREEVFILSFAIIMLNTDLHVPNLKTRMTLGQWIKNLRGVFQGGDLSDEYLTEIYDRVKSNELKTVPDHVTQVLKVQQSLVAGNTKLTSQVPSLCLPHRRLVCYCRLYEVYDISRKDRQGQHQREIFLFNDMLLVTKVYKKNVQTSNGTNMTLYSYRGSYALQGLSIILFKAPHYPYGLRLQRRLDEKVIITFNARNEHDLSRFVDDLKESIEESNQMEYIRIGLRASNAFEMSLGCTSRSQDGCRGPLRQTAGRKWRHAPVARHWRHAQCARKRRHDQVELTQRLVQ
ncbi:IQ motif and SEC7 domain-containing protein 1 [Halotydeus destructor]|nr:IQ motif and SEC7 domain-containing protein 1 [Halotydeus destructor]